MQSDGWKSRTRFCWRPRRVIIVVEGSENPMRNLKPVLTYVLLPVLMVSTNAPALASPVKTKQTTLAPSAQTGPRYQSPRTWVDCELDRLEILLQQFQSFYGTAPEEQPPFQTYFDTVIDLPASGVELVKVIATLDKLPKTESQKLRFQSALQRLEQTPAWTKYQQIQQYNAERKQQMDAIKNAPSAAEIHEFLNSPYPSAASPSPPSTQNKTGGKDAGKNNKRPRTN